ncbi:Imm8 family immunity protein [Lonepinella sp. MS14436]|uniref:Imm8 family immunity protein n=1 Tax=Lonepinella sp. MS14436 TaxID=3003619 RepID=UPI0036D928D7
MLFAELKNIAFDGFSDLNSVQKFILESEVISLNVCLYIGVNGIDGADNFNAFLVNLNWIKNYIREHGIFIESNTVIIDNFDDLDDVFNYLSSVVCRVYGEDWNEITHKLSQYFDWEYSE